MIIKKISKKIDNGEEISPFLFVGQNLEILNSEINKIILELFEKYEVPKVNLIKLEDNGENIKISEIKQFIQKGNLGTPYKFQIFLIENISRMTLQSFNSCLKFFEEPGKQNIIFLTNKSESGILDTILSRVQIINFNKVALAPCKEENAFYFTLLDNYFNKKSTEIFSYFFRNKLEKFEYIEFLYNIILYSKKNFVLINLLEEINEDINLIEKNNVNAKGIVDKYLLKI